MTTAGAWPVLRYRVVGGKEKKGYGRLCLGRRACLVSAPSGTAEWIPPRWGHRWDRDAQIVGSGFFRLATTRRGKDGRAGGHTAG